MYTIKDNKEKEVNKLVYNKSEIARKTGLSRVSVSNILNHKEKNPKLETLKKIAMALNCSVDDLLKEES